MTEWYVLANLALIGIALLAASVAGGRIRWPAMLLAFNFIITAWAAALGLGGWQWKALASVFDIATLASALYALQSRPMASGLHVVGFVMAVSVVAHWAAHVASGFGAAVSLPYFSVTNGATAIAALCLIWTALQIVRARDGLASGIHGPFGFSLVGRVPVGARFKGGTQWTTPKV
jgi:hypothetical protein